MGNGQAIRPSQFITTYGVGSILEGPAGPRVVKAFDLSTLFADPSMGTPDPMETPAHYEVVEPRLTALLSGARIFRIPTNDELGLPAHEEIYRTEPFPKWSLCVRPGHNLIYRLEYTPQQSTLVGCPACGPIARNAAWEKARLEAISFVQACNDGHLDDVNWRAAVPHTRNDCPARSFRWTGGGSSLRNVTIVCSDCGGAESLGIIYGRRVPCSGRRAEQRAVREQCGREAHVHQRGDSSLRLPEIVSSLTIPPKSTAIHNVFASLAFQGVITAVDVTSKAQIVAMATAMSQAGVIRPAALTALQAAPEEEILRAVHDIRNAGTPPTRQTMREDELAALKRAADSGAPPVPHRNPALPHLFEVISSEVRTFTRPSGRTIRVTPVNRLRVVMAQTGYRRRSSDPAESNLVTCSYTDGQHTWYPGVELSGEGIFVDFPGTDPHFPLAGADACAWLGAWRAQQQLELHPVFVWWHTLAHRLMTTLAVDSGYAAASIRERIFTKLVPNSEEAYGGLLLYTAQPGGDGTLGGLISLVPRFDRLLDRAELYLDACSNDPICEEERFQPERANGAACYACQLISETSCEHRNMRLDRNVLRGNRA